MNICKYYYNRIISFLCSIYEVYIKNIILYFFPLEMKMSFNKESKKIMYVLPSKWKNINITDNDFIYKMNKINYKNGKLYNFGYYYHTTKEDAKYFKIEPEIAFPPSDIHEILITMRSINLDKTYEINLDNNFISNILSYSTKDSNLSILIYYYLQIYLNIFDIITDVSLGIDDNYYKVNYEETLNSIYDIDLI